METKFGLLASAVFFDTMPVTMSADAVLANSADCGSAPARREAELFLRSTLADGPMAAKKIKVEALDAGLAWKTVWRAKDALGVKSSKTSVKGGWLWSLPEDGQP